MGENERLRKLKPEWIGRLRDSGRSEAQAESAWREVAKRVDRGIRTSGADGTGGDSGRERDPERARLRDRMRSENER